MPRKHDTEKVVDIIRDAGGTIVGRTRLQKIAYLLELSGLGEGFHFQYKRYGPFSEELASAVRDTNALGMIQRQNIQLPGVASIPFSRRRKARRRRPIRRE